jgi:dual specificity tyrosine-phosphorylation-regulated kinase 2/3/4
MSEHFYFRNHLCIAMELLSINLYELIKANGFVGFTTALIRRFTSQMLLSLSLMRHHRIVHCDLKPEVGFFLMTLLTIAHFLYLRMCYCATLRRAQSKSLISAVAVSSMKKVGNTLNLKIEYF